MEGVGKEQRKGVKEEEKSSEGTGRAKSSNEQRQCLHLKEYVIKGRNCIFSRHAYIILILDYIINLYF